MVVLHNLLIEVIQIYATVEVGGYPDGSAIFEEQIITTNMSAGGDSGSLLVNGQKAVGLLFAGSSLSSFPRPTIPISMNTIRSNPMRRRPLTMSFMTTRRRGGRFLLILKQIKWEKRKGCQ